MKLTGTNESNGLTIDVQEIFIVTQVTLHFSEFSSVAKEEGRHLIPFRTQKLSLPSPMVLCTRAGESRTLPSIFFRGLVCKGLATHVFGLHFRPVQFALLELPQL